MIDVDAIQQSPECRLPYKNGCHMATDGDIAELQRKRSMNNTQQSDLFAKMLDDRMNSLTDQQVTDRYVKELLKLKTLNQFGRHSARFLGYPNTLMMKRCRRELERRGLPVPPVNPPGDTQAWQEGQEPCS